MQDNKTHHKIIQKGTGNNKDECTKKHQKQLEHKKNTDHYCCVIMWQNSEEEDELPPVTGLKALIFFDLFQNIYQEDIQL